ncbi:hypothetical protein L210DRAFT_3499116 [Boletus edulis BED1]|uniref:Uncharacterized protein n=1 Tax=Boletus edulis BED1 TaxID=1328754 RepID=A0AAD4C9B0_BOLED|nr:hypothetical protein L210DRAFT_3499116 [Boletus edulis BED1]
MVRESGGAEVVTRGMWAIGCLTAAVWTFLSLRSFSLARATSKRNPICDDAEENERELGEEHGKDDLRVGTVGSDSEAVSQILQAFGIGVLKSVILDIRTRRGNVQLQRVVWLRSAHWRNSSNEGIVFILIQTRRVSGALTPSSGIRRILQPTALPLALTLLSIIAVAAAMPIVNDMALDRRDCQSQGTQGDEFQNLRNCSGNFGRP